MLSVGTRTYVSTYICELKIKQKSYNGWYAQPLMLLVLMTLVLILLVLILLVLGLLVLMGQEIHEKIQQVNF